ncbi:hypothetical protein [Haloechinothrix sp. LS1_15]|uniref:hypothetical protein n=1 Tax=Haloechinothrix sp. LS1_15 TaxID=2652248 RepID=UPI0029464294|nr:hypothetical protein [Haloechinothrix sp. LS1_15]MDV6013292.1 hypothetical protein [Haloechinothrix sp. LS1_15]
MNVSAHRPSPHRWVVFAGLAILLAGCGNGEAGHDIALPGEQACDLITEAEFADILDASQIDVESTDATQCDYRSVETYDGANVVRGEDLSAMHTEETVEIRDIEAIRLELDGPMAEGCGVDVNLTSDNGEQQFGVIVTPVSDNSGMSACELADTVAGTILDGAS